MDKLTEELKNSLICNVEDGLEDYLELAIDNFIEDGILKDIPIVNSIVNSLKFAKNIYDRNLLKQTLVFISELNNGTINKDKLIAYKSTIENNHKKCEKELGRVLLLLNNFIDQEKSVMLSKVFKAYIEQVINWHEFCEYSEVINRIFIQDIDILNRIFCGKRASDFNVNEKYRMDRLSSIGLIRIRVEGAVLTEDAPTKLLTPFGKKFISIISDKIK